MTLAISPVMAIDFERQQFFWSRVRKDGEHLIWEGAHTTRGYGKITINNRNEYAHRVAYCIAKNLDLKAIDDKIILITCNAPGCCEPKHLIAKQKRSVT